MHAHTHAHKHVHKPKQTPLMPVRSEEKKNKSPSSKRHIVFESVTVLWPSRSLVLPSLPSLPLHPAPLRTATSPLADAEFSSVQKQPEINLLPDRRDVRINRPPALAPQLGRHLILFLGLALINALMRDADVCISDQLLSSEDSRGGLSDTFRKCSVAYHVFELNL